MKNTYENQILNLCVQTYYNLYGTMPGTAELIEMLGDEYIKIIMTSTADGGGRAA